MSEVDTWTPQDVQQAIDNPIHQQLVDVVGETLRSVLNFRGPAVADHEQPAIDLIAGMTAVYLENLIVKHAFKISRINAEQSLRTMFDMRST